MLFSFHFYEIINLSEATTSASEASGKLFPFLQRLVWERIFTYSAEGIMR